MSTHSSMTKHTVTVADSSMTKHTVAVADGSMTQHTVIVVVSLALGIKCTGMDAPSEWKQENPSLGMDLFVQINLCQLIFALDF